MRLVFPVCALLVGLVCEASAGESEGSDRVAALKTELAKSGLAVRCEAYEGHAPDVLEADLERLAAVVREVSGREGAGPASRSKHVLLNNSFDKESYDAKTVLGVRKSLEPDLGAVISLQYPQNPAIARRAGEEPLPVVLVPGRKRLDEALKSFLDGLPEDKSTSGAEVPNAGTLWFKPFAGQVLDDMPCPSPGPLPGHPWSPPRAELVAFVSPAAQGRVVSQGDLLEDAAARIAKAEGTELLGRADVFEPKPGVWFVRYRIGEEPAFWTWAVPVADANGAARWTREGEAISAKAYRNQVAVSPESGSRYENRIGGIAWKKLGRQNLLVLPFPRPVGSAELEGRKDGIASLPLADRSAHRPHERLTVNGKLLADHPVLVLRKAETWKPFMEDVDLDERLAFHGEDKDSARAVVLSADAGADELQAAISAYYGVGKK